MPAAAGNGRPGDLPTDVGHRALDWLVAHLPAFHPRHPWSDDFRWKLKVYVELLFLCNLLLRHRHWRRHPAVRALVSFGRSACQTSDPIALAHHDPLGLSGLAVVGEFARLSGRGPRLFAAALRRFVGAGYIDAADRVPFRRMDLAYSLGRAGVPGGLPGPGDLYPQTVAGRAPLLPYLASLDVYSITHTIFYLTDMGHSPPGAWSALAGPELPLRVLWLLGMAVRQDDMDLTAELLMCCAFLRLGASPVTAAAWRTLQRRQMPDGAMPGPTYSPAHAAGPGAEEQERYRFEHCYHCTLVTVGAAASWPGTGR